MDQHAKAGDLVLLSMSGAIGTKDTALMGTLGKQ